MITRYNGCTKSPNVSSTEDIREATQEKSSVTGRPYPDKFLSTAGKSVSKDTSDASIVRRVVDMCGSIPANLIGMETARGTIHTYELLTRRCTSGFTR